MKKSKYKPFTSRERYLIKEAYRLILEAEEDNMDQTADPNVGVDPNADPSQQQQAAPQATKGAPAAADFETPQSMAAWFDANIGGTEKIAAEGATLLPNLCLFLNQALSKHRDTFIQFMDMKTSQDAKFALDAGDGAAGFGEGEGGAVEISKLYPTQNEIDLFKSVGWVLSDVATGGLEWHSGNILSPDGRNEPIVTGAAHKSPNIPILDGHHRWSAMRCLGYDKISATAIIIPGVNLEGSTPGGSLVVGQIAIANVQARNNKKSMPSAAGGATEKDPQGNPMYPSGTGIQLLGASPSDITKKMKESWGVYNPDTKALMGNLLWWKVLFSDDGAMNGFNKLFPETAELLPAARTAIEGLAAPQLDETAAATWEQNRSRLEKLKAKILESSSNDASDAANSIDMLLNAEPVQIAKLVDGFFKFIVGKKIVPSIEYLDQIEGANADDKSFVSGIIKPLRGKKMFMVKSALKKSAEVGGMGLTTWFSDVPNSQEAEAACKLVWDKIADKIGANWGSIEKVPQGSQRREEMPQYGDTGAGGGAKAFVDADNAAGGSNWNTPYLGESIDLQRWHKLAGILKD